MKKLMLAFLISSMCCGVAYAQQGGFTGPSTIQTRGGYTGPSMESIYTVDRVKQLRDDSRVRLQGAIVQHLGKDKYLFRDSTGEIVIEIDDDDWNGVIVGPNDRVEIEGEIDKDWNSIEIDVRRIRKLP